VIRYIQREELQLMEVSNGDGTWSENVVNSVTNGSWQLEDVGSREEEGHWRHANAWHKCLIGTRIDEQHLEMLINCRTVAHMWIRLAIVHEQDSKENVHIL
jgi:hypothetical protein